MPKELPVKNSNFAYRSWDGWMIIGYAIGMDRWLLGMQLEWMDDYCLTPSEESFSYIMAKNKICRKTCQPTQIYYSDSKLTSLLLHLNAACLAKKQQIPILKSIVWPDQRLNPLYPALEASMITIKPPRWCYLNWKATQKFLIRL